MTVIPGRDMSYMPLIASLMDSFETAGRIKAVLPEGGRVEVASLLTRLMADPDELGAYTTSLEAERRRRGPEVELTLIGMDGLDLPDARIAAEGFGGLSDDQLADIALSPEALRALKETLDDPQTEPGPWFIDAVLEAEAARPDAAEQARRAAEIYRHLEAADLLGPRSKSRRGAPALRWGGRIAALAASLLIGVFLGSNILRDGRVEGIESFSTSIAPAPAPGRGVEDWWWVEIRSDLPGFATVVALGPGSRPEILPGLGGEDEPVDPGAPALVGPLPQSTTRALSVITETPAGEPIRRALRARNFGPDQIEELKEFLRTTLESKGYRRMAFGSTALTQ
jgi:hypothetical protein